MRLSVLALVVFAVVMAGCGSSVPVSPSPDPVVTPVPSLASSPSPSPTPEPSPVITPSPAPTSPARTVTSDDGLLTVDVPAGALPIGVNLTAMAQDEADLPPELAGLDVRSAFYKLEPDGTVFASPVTITRRVALKDLGLKLANDGLPVLALALRSAGGTWEWLDDQQLMFDGSFVVVSGAASHASQVFAFGGTTFTRFSLDDQSPRPIGSSVTLTSTLDFPDDAVDPPTLGDDFEPIVESDIMALGVGAGPEGGSLSQEFRCLRHGTSFVGVRYSVLNVGAESVLFEQLGLGPISTAVTVGGAVTCLPDASPPPSTTASVS